MADHYSNSIKAISDRNISPPLKIILISAWEKEQIKKAWGYNKRAKSAFLFTTMPEEYQ
jgi:hypothetical protein